VRSCSEIPLFAIFVGSVPHIRVAVRFSFTVRVAVGVWMGVLQCFLQRCCRLAVQLFCPVCVVAELLRGLLFQCVLQCELFLQCLLQWVRCWVWCCVFYSVIFFFGFGLDWLCSGV